MKLAISLSLDNGNWNLYLADELSHPFKIVISQKSLAHLFNERWIVPLINNDKDGLIKRVSSNQLIVLIYFYILPQSPSLLIMKKWFSEINCDSFQIEYLSDLIHKTRISDNYDPDSFYNLHCESTVNEMILSYNELNLHNKISWSFNLELDNSEVNSRSANLTSARESYFMIDDHSFMFVGFSISFRSFIELLSAYKPDIFDSLCRLVAIQDRDIKTLGQILIEVPEIEEIIRKTFPGGVWFFGIDKLGILINYTNLKSFTSEVTPDFKTMMIFLSETISVVPLFMKLTK